VKCTSRHAAASAAVAMGTATSVAAGAHMTSTCFGRSITEARYKQV